MKLIIIISVLCITWIKGELPSMKRPHTSYGTPNFIQKSKQPLRTIMIQIRSGSRLPPGLHVKNGPHMMMQRLRPIKIIPHTIQKPYATLLKRPQHQTISPNYITPKPFQSSPPGPHTGEYIFENPFSSNKIPQQIQQQQHNQIQQSAQPIENTIRLTMDSAGPIHTIPAPNLSSNNGNYQTLPDLSFQHDNHISLTDSNSIAYHQSTLGPYQYHQYQVTEDPTNDQTIQDPFSGHNKYFAPDPDPSLPARGISPALDPFSKPSNNNNLPIDVAASATLTDSYYQFVNPVPQQQLPDTYGLPINSQPQLQQHLLQQASLVPGMPLSVYNPTYLVQQSNNLFNQHQQHQQLFKPDSNFLTSYNPSGIQEYQPSYNYQSQGGGIQTVASPGQIYAAAQEQQSNNFNDPFTASASQNAPAIAQFLDTPQPSNIKKSKKHFQSSQKLTSDDYSNFVNLENFHNVQSTQSSFDMTQRQKENEQILAQAQQQLYESQALEQQQHQQQQIHQQQLQQQQQQQQQQTSTVASAHEQHQQLLSQQLTASSLSPMRIFVPDDEQQLQQQQQYQDQQNYHDQYKFQHRSDDYSYENISSEDRSGELASSEMPQFNSNENHGAKELS